MIEILSNNPSIFWLALGAIAIVIEVISFSGIIFLHVGISAITVGGLLLIGVVPADNVTIQASVFFGFTCLWAAILWKPLQKIRSGNPDDKFSNVVGETAVIIENDLIKGKPGKAKWSGTTMTARLSDESESEKIEKGSEVTIVKIDGTTIFVK